MMLHVHRKKKLHLSDSRAIRLKDFVYIYIYIMFCIIYISVILINHGFKNCITLISIQCEVWTVFD